MALAFEVTAHRCWSHFFNGATYESRKKMGIPVNLRSGFAISTKNGKAANAMTVDEWEELSAASTHTQSGLLSSDRSRARSNCCAGAKNAGGKIWRRCALSK